MPPAWNRLLSGACSLILDGWKATSAGFRNQKRVVKDSTPWYGKVAVTNRSNRLSQSPQGQSGGTDSALEALAVIKGSQCIFSSCLQLTRFIVRARGIKDFGIGQFCI